MPRHNSGRRNVIGLVVNTVIKPHRDVMLGWMRYGRSHRNIELRFFIASVATSTDNILEFVRSGVDALLLCGLQEDTVDNLLKSGNLDIPVVVCAHASSCKMEHLDTLPNVGMVLADSAAIGRHVGEFFLGHGLVNFAFMGMNERDRIYGRTRCEAFCATVMAEEDGGKTFSEKTFGVCRENGDFWDHPQRDILTWISSLPLPCGVFINGDRPAALFVDACDRLGIDIPGKIEVVSVNNSYGICEGLGTTISSIQPDFDECARQSIELALKMMASAPGLTAESRRIMVSAHRLIERSSSLSGRSHGKLVTRTKEFIRHNACDGITVMDVVNHLGVSRRTLETRVKYATGSSVLALIRNVRLKNICRLLETTNLSLSEVITRSGYNLTGNAGMLFKKAYGITMRQYRMKNAKRKM